MSLAQFCDKLYKYDYDYISNCVVTCNDINEIINIKNNSTLLIHIANTSYTRMNLRLMQLLIKCRADLEILSKNGNTALACAVTCNNEEYVEILVHAGANLGDALHLACYMAHPKYDIIEILINAGANINAQDSNGDTPIMLLANSGNVDTSSFKLLIDSGADINIKNNAGKSLLDKAGGNQKNELIKILVTSRLGTPSLVQFAIENKLTELINILSKAGLIREDNVPDWLKPAFVNVREKYEYQIRPGINFWNLIHAEFPNACKYDLFKAI